jgi:hypothetical protein
MQRFYRVVYRIDKGDDTGTIFDRIADAVARSSAADYRRSFLFIDPLARKQRSAVEQLVKAYPVFEPYRQTRSVLPTREAVIVTNGEHDADSHVPVETLAEVARGIPRRFPFGNATFSWHGVPAVITLISKWGPQKRALELTALVPFHGEEQSASGKPKLPEATQALLDAIGRAKTGEFFALPRADGTVDEIFNHARSALAERIAQVPLEPLRTEPGAELHENPGSVKEPLTAALAPLGYAPGSGAGPGLLVFAKRTSDGDDLRITVDRGTWSHHFIAHFEIRNERWRRSLRIPLARNDFPGRQYALIDHEQIDALCRNTAAVVREIETIVYAPVRDALHL